MRRIRGMAVLAVGALVVAGCSDEELDTEPGQVQIEPTTEEPTTDTEPTTEPPVDTEPTTAPPVDTEPTTEEPTTEEPTTEEPDEGLPENAEAWLDRHGRQLDPDPRAAAVELFAIEYAIAASQGDPDRPEWVETLSSLGYDERLIYIENDLGLWYPGPLPLAIVDYGQWDGRESVQACGMLQGFALDPQTEEPAADTLISPMDIVLEPDESGFVVHEVYGGTFDCEGLEPEVLEW